MSAHYDQDGNLIDWMEWGRLFEDTEARRIGDTHVFVRRRWWHRRREDVWISTVWLGIDHNFQAVGPPLIFETMVFGGHHDEATFRYSTREQAIEGHARVVAAITEGRDPE